MELLVLDGKTYVKAAAAADMTGYTRDYVGQLCRSGKVDAHLIGRTWYVRQDQLRTHQAEKKRSSRTKAREQVRRAVAESAQEKQERHLTVQEGGGRAFEKRVRYEEDDTSLMPEVRKLAVSTGGKKKRKGGAKGKKQAKDTAPNYTIENKGEKILMSGKLDVINAEDESAIDEDLVVLEPKISKQAATERHPHKNRNSKENKVISDKKLKPITDENAISDVDEGIEDVEGGGTDFLQKLAEHDVHAGGEGGSEGESADVANTEHVMTTPAATIAVPETARASQQRSSVLIPVVAVISLCLAAAMIALEQRVVSTDTTPTVTTYTPDFTAFLELLNKKR